jgi:hypothetical protein
MHHPDGALLSSPSAGAVVALRGRSTVTGLLELAALVGRASGAHRLDVAQQSIQELEGSEHHYDR